MNSMLHSGGHNCIIYHHLRVLLVSCTTNHETLGIAWRAIPQVVPHSATHKNITFVIKTDKSFYSMHLQHTSHTIFRRGSSNLV